MEYQTLTAVELRPIVVLWQQLRVEGWEIDSSVKHVFNWKKFRFEYKLKVYRNDMAELNEVRLNDAL